MSRDDIDALIRRLEGVAQANPRLFLFRLVGWVVLAYGYLGIILLGSLGLSLGIVATIVFVPNAATIKLGIIGLVLFGGLFWAIARGLWVRLTPPEGLALTCAQSPQLFALLDELRAALDCRPFHRVLLVTEHNAAVVQIPRLGVFGWHRNYLLLGLPLMQSLAPEEFKAVLAHEFAHSSRGHGRFGNWIYRVRRSWDRIFEQLARQGRGGKVLSAFVKWFWPRFNAHAFVLARANEYEADACSVRLAGAQAAARALMRLPVDGQFLSEKFWPGVFDRATREKEPPANAFATLGGALKSGPTLEDSARWLRQAFLLETNNADTHPCLKDRLRAMGQLPPGVERGEFPAGPPPPPVNAVEFFLGSQAGKFAEQMSGDWRREIEPGWTARHEQAQKLATELAELEKPAEAPPDVDELWKRAGKLIELHGDAAALPVLEHVLTLDPQHVGANFVRGRVYLEADDARGVALIEAALAADPMITSAGCNLLYGYYSRTGQRAQLRPLEDRVDRFQEEAARAQQERANVTAADTFAAHELKPAEIEALAKALAAEAEIVSAAVARKFVRVFPKSPCFVLGLRLKVSWWKPRSSTASQHLVNRVIKSVQLPGHFLVFVAEGNLKSLAKKVFAVPGAVVYQRPRLDYTQRHKS